MHPVGFENKVNQNTSFPQFQNFRNHPGKIGFVKPAHFELPRNRRVFAELVARRQANRLFVFSDCRIIRDNAFAESAAEFPVY